MDVHVFTLRDGTEADEPFFFRVFAENKAREFEALCLSGERLQPLLVMQYRARCAGYVSSHPDARQLVIEEGHTPVGQILLSEGPSSIQIVDIAIVPEHQARGLGTAVLLAMQARAHSEAKELRLQVVPHSPARRLYGRLGFIVTASDTMIDEMAWTSRRAQTL